MVHYKPVIIKAIFCPFGNERVYLPLCKVADTPLHIQGDDLFTWIFVNVVNDFKSLSINSAVQQQKPLSA